MRNLSSLTPSVNPRFHQAPGVVSVAASCIPKGARAMMVERQFLSVAEVAELIGISEATLRRWRSRGENPELRSIKIGGSVRYPVADVQAFIDLQYAGATEGDRASD